MLKRIFPTVGRIGSNYFRCCWQNTSFDFWDGISRSLSSTTNNTILIISSSVSQGLRNWADEINFSGNCGLNQEWNFYKILCSKILDKNPRTNNWVGIKLWMDTKSAINISQSPPRNWHRTYCEFERTRHIDRKSSE